MSCKAISKLALAKIRPVIPPKVNIKVKPKEYKPWPERSLIFLPWRVESQLNTLIPVGIAITIVALVK